MGHSDYHYQHEPILFGYKPGKGRLGRGNKGWYGNDAQTSLIQVDRPTKNKLHPTAKPTDLISQLLSNSVPPNKGIVLEPFGGSGSCLIAGEMIGVSVYACELSPEYCSVILARWESYTGQDAVRVHA